MMGKVPGKEIKPETWCRGNPASSLLNRGAMHRMLFWIPQMILVGCLTFSHPAWVLGQSSVPRAQRVTDDTSPEKSAKHVTDISNALAAEFTFSETAQPALPNPAPYDPSAPRVVRHSDPESLEVNLRGVPIHQGLVYLAKATGWRIYAEPDLDTVLNIAFRRVPIHDALPRLLRDLNYALLEGTNKTRRLLVFSSNAAKATQLMDDDRVANHLIVRISDESKLTAEELAKLLGGELKGSITELNAHLLTFEDADAAEAARKKLAEMDGIAGVEDNFHTLPPEMAQMMDLVNQSTLNLKPAALDGDRLLVGLIDTAVQNVGGAFDAFLVDRLSISGTAPDTGELQHGTSMYVNLVKAAEIALGPGAEANFGVLAVDVYGESGTSTAFDVARGIAAAVGEGATIINASLGSNQPSPILQDVIRTYQDQGVLFIAAAGNEPVYTPTFPAGYPEVLAVSAVMADGSFAPYANRSPTVDLFLPGTGLVPYAGDFYRISGTSVSAARASGIATALWLQGNATRPVDLGPILLNGFGRTAP